MIEFARAPAWLEDIEERRFVCWGWRDSPSGKPTKPPLKPNGAPASTSDARTWRTLPVVLKALEKQDTIDDKKLDGIGYVLTQDDRHIAFDLDHCRDPKTGTLLPWARELLARLDTYTELTPSGEGARAIGTAPPGWRDKVHASLPMGENGEKVEIFYHYPRYITVTGHLAPGAPEDLGDVSAATDEILARAAPGKTDANGTRFDADADLEAATFGDLNQTVRRISPDIGYADWVKVGLALKAAGTPWPEESRALWIEWSALSKKYAEDNERGVAEKKWDELVPDGRAGYGSLVYMSREHPVHAEAVTPATSEPTFAERQVEMDARAAEEWQDLMSPPGLVGDLTRYARGIAYIDAPRAALAGALATVSTVAGNQAAVAMPRGAVPLNLFVLILGPTVVGKEGANRLAHHVLGAIDQLDVKVRPASDVALHKHLVDTGGGAFLVMDEYGTKHAIAVIEK